MTFVIRPGSFMIEKSRRRIIGVIARVGTGGSVPGPVQNALDDYARSLAEGHSGGDAKTIVASEKQTIRQGMKKMAGSWLVLSPAGLRWAFGDDTKALQATLRNSGWNPPTAKVATLFLKKS